MMKEIQCIVNGRERHIMIDVRESLTDMLRHHLNLSSVKKGCEVGECGACTVLVDGKATNSCIYLAIWADGKTILTVEGLQDDEGNLNPVQQAFVDTAAVQCGFCTPGIIMTGVEIVNRGQRYTRDELRKEISGHLCRCTGYQNIINAIEQAVDIIHTQQPEKE